MTPTAADAPAESTAETAETAPHLTLVVRNDPEPEPPTPAAPRLTRADHCQAISASGGLACLARHGRAHYVAIGTAGARTTIERHGVAYWQGADQGEGMERVVSVRSVV